MSNIAKTLGVLAVALFTLPMAGDQLKESHVIQGDICALQQAGTRGRVETSGQIQRVGRQYLISSGGCSLDIDWVDEAFEDGGVYTLNGVMFGGQLQDVEISQRASSVALDAEGGVISTQRTVPLSTLKERSTCLDSRYQPSTWPIGCQRAKAYINLNGEIVYALSKKEVPHLGPTCAVFDMTASPKVATRVTLIGCEQVAATR
jgi:hypothetical protein